MAADYLGMAYYWLPPHQSMRSCVAFVLLWIFGWPLVDVFVSHTVASVLLVLLFANNFLMGLGDFRNTDGVGTEWERSANSAAWRRKKEPASARSLGVGWMVISVALLGLHVLQGLF